MGLTSGEEGSDGGVFVCNYAKVEGNQLVMVEVLQVLEVGEVDPEDVELPSVPVLLEGIWGKDEEDEGESLKRGEFLKPIAILPLVVVEGGNLVGDLIAVFVLLVDIVR